MTETSTMTEMIIEGIRQRKGRQISVVDLSRIESAATGQFIICSGSSTTQVSSIADNVREHLRKQAGIKPYNYDGYQNSQWIIIDYGDILVHVFLPDTRRLYNLEELWNDATITEVPDLD